MCKESTQRYPANVTLWRQRLALLCQGLAEEKLLVDALHQARKLVPERVSAERWFFCAPINLKSILQESLQPVSSEHGTTEG